MKDCNSCGKCCVKYGNGGLSITNEEIEFWDVFRPKIADYVRDGKIWMNPKTGEQLEVCPWLKKVPNEEKYLCDIYFDRPDDCKYYPVTVEEMIRDECEMIELKDLDDPVKAQETLDKIMVDSRPSYS